MTEETKSEEQGAQSITNEFNGAASAGSFPHGHKQTFHKRKYFSDDGHTDISFYGGQNEGIVNTPIAGDSKTTNTVVGNEINVKLPFRIKAHPSCRPPQTPSLMATVVLDTEIAIGTLPQTLEGSLSTPKLKQTSVGFGGGLGINSMRTNAVGSPLTVGWDAQVNAVLRGRSVNNISGMADIPSYKMMDANDHLSLRNTSLHIEPEATLLIDKFQIGGKASYNLKPEQTKTLYSGENFIDTKVNPFNAEVSLGYKVIDKDKMDAQIFVKGKTKSSITETYRDNANSITKSLETGPTISVGLKLNL